MSPRFPVVKIIARVIVFLVLCAGVIACLYLIREGQLSNRESALLGILVTILSVLASWVITDMYASSQYENAINQVRDEHRDNLRTYALKAAEKVNNLSNELNKLSVYLEEELNYTDYHSTEEELLAKEERIESAIHLVRTLKSVNDTALSDWEGVIGDELNQRREEKEEREEQLRALIERAEALTQDNRFQKDTEALHKELRDLRNTIRLAAFQLGETPIPKSAREKQAKQNVSLKCPSCDAPLEYRQKAIARSLKAVPCKACGMKLVSRYDPKIGFQLAERKPEPVEIQCPSCFSKDTVSLDIFPSTSIQTVCKNCAVPLRIIRGTEGAVRVTSPPVIKKLERDIPEEIVNKVRSALPAQPWPRGIHQTVASNLGLPPQVVTRCIQELTRQGVFRPQIDGVLYVPMPKA